MPSKSRKAFCFARPGESGSIVSMLSAFADPLSLDFSGSPNSTFKQRERMQALSLPISRRPQLKKSGGNHGTLVSQTG